MGVSERFYRYDRVCDDASPDVLWWEHNQENDIAGYRLYHGRSSGNYSQVLDVGNNNQ